jgi:hypothetical protein
MPNVESRIRLMFITILDNKTNKQCPQGQIVMETTNLYAKKIFNINNYEVVWTR